MWSTWNSSSGARKVGTSTLKLTRNSTCTAVTSQTARGTVARGVRTRGAGGPGAEAGGERVVATSGARRRGERGSASAEFTARRLPVTLSGCRTAVLGHGRGRAGIIER